MVSTLVEMPWPLPIFSLSMTPFYSYSPNKEEIVALTRILTCFEMTFGLKINLAKSVMVGMGCSDELVQPLASIFKCKVGKLPLAYQGLPLGANMRSKAVWNPMIENLERKLSACKSNSLSFGRRISLIKATLSNLPVYCMSLFNAGCSERDFGLYEEEFLVGRVE